MRMESLILMKTGHSWMKMGEAEDAIDADAAGDEGVCGGAIDEDGVDEDGDGDRQFRY